MYGINLPENRPLVFVVRPYCNEKHKWEPVLGKCKKYFIKNIDKHFRQLYNMNIGNCLKGVDIMDVMKKLPDAEFDIMKVVWANAPPISTGTIMEQLGNGREWKAPTAISLMNRLVERGFLCTEKNGKERVYYPLISRDDYLQFETKHFIKTYHENSFVSFVTSLYGRKELNEADIEELIAWTRQRGK